MAGEDVEPMSDAELAEIRAWNSEYHGWEEQPASDYVDDLLAELDRLKAQRESDMKYVPSGTLTIGRIVLYTLSGQDAEHINRRRVPLLDSIAQAKVGAQVHVGNHASEGQVFPLLICRVWEPVGHHGVSAGVNGQVFLDGNDTLWVTSRKEGNEPGAWHWPERTYSVVQD